MKFVPIRYYSWYVRDWKFQRCTC